MSVVQSLCLADAARVDVVCDGDADAGVKPAEIVGASLVDCVASDASMDVQVIKPDGGTLAVAVGKKDDKGNWLNYCYTKVGENKVLAADLEDKKYRRQILEGQGVMLTVDFKGQWGVVGVQGPKLIVNGETQLSCAIRQNQLTVLADVAVNRDNLKDFLKEAKDITASTRAERGNMEYTFLESISESDNDKPILRTKEVWRNELRLDLHMKRIADFLTKVTPWLKADPEILTVPTSELKSYKP